MGVAQFLPVCLYSACRPSFPADSVAFSFWRKMRGGRDGVATCNRTILLLLPPSFWAAACGISSRLAFPFGSSGSCCLTLLPFSSSQDYEHGTACQPPAHPSLPSISPTMPSPAATFCPQAHCQVCTPFPSCPTTCSPMPSFFFCLVPLPAKACTRHGMPVAAPSFLMYACHMCLYFSRLSSLSHNAIMGMVCGSDRHASHFAGGRRRRRRQTGQ